MITGTNASDRLSLVLEGRGRAKEVERKRERTEWTERKEEKKDEGRLKMFSCRKVKKKAVVDYLIYSVATSRD